MTELQSNQALVGLNRVKGHPATSSVGSVRNYNSQRYLTLKSMALESPTLKAKQSPAKNTYKSNGNEGKSGKLTPSPGTAPLLHQHNNKHSTDLYHKRKLLMP